MPNDKIIDLTYIENYRSGAGFEIDTTTKDDYINLSIMKYLISHLILNLGTLTYLYHLKTDVYINPTFKIDDRPLVN